MRVPVGVEYDDGISGLQIETKATSSGAEQEDEGLRVGCVKFS